MADDTKTTQIQVPTFTVLKNGSILKKIYLLRKQYSSPNQESILLVGRHPHCNIRLEHPSISRHHLRIHSVPSLRLISVVDLASVHGTWVSGKRIEAGVNVGLKEGDTVKMGGSSRVYELHWVPLSQAYNVDGRFLSTIYTIKEGEEEMNQGGKLKTQSSDGELEGSDLSLPDNIQDSPLQTLSSGTSLDPEYVSSSCDDTELVQSNSFKADNENGEIIGTILVTSLLVVPGTISPIEDSDSLSESDQVNLLGDNLSNDFELQNHGIVKKDLVSVSNCSESSCGVTEVEDSSSSKTSTENCIEFSSVSVHAPTPPVVSRSTSTIDISDGLKELEDPLNWLKDNLSNEFDLQSHGIIREDVCSVPNCSIFSCNGSEVEHWIPWNIGYKDGHSQDISSSLNKSEDWSNWLRDNLNNEFEQLSYGTLQDDLIYVNHHDAIKTHEKDVLNQNTSRSNDNEPLDEQEFGNGSLPVALFEAVIRDEEKSFMLDGPQDNEMNVGCEFEQMTQTALMNKSVSEVLFEGVESKVEDDVFYKSIESGEEEVDLGVKCESIDHEIMEEKLDFEVLSNETDIDHEETFSPDILRTKEVHMNLEAMKNVLGLMNFLDRLDGNELGLFTTDKENKNPNDCSRRSLKKTLKNHQNYCTMSTEAISPTINDEKDIFGSSKTLATSVDEVNPLVYCEEVLLSSSENESQSSQTKMVGSCSSNICPQTIEKVIDSSHDEKLETQSSDDDLECSNLSLPDTIHDLPLKTLSMGTFLHQEYFSCCEDSELEQSNLSKTDNENGERFSTILVHSPHVVSGTIAAIEDSENGERFSTNFLNLFDSLNGNELELFTPDKENKNPNDCSRISLEKTWKDGNYCMVSTEAAGPTVKDEKGISSFSKVLEEVNPFLKSEEVLLSSSEKESQSSQTKMVGRRCSIICPQTVEKVDELNSFIGCEEVSLSSSEKESLMKMEGSCSSIIFPQTVEKVDELNSFIGCEKVLLSSSEKESLMKMEGSCSSIIFPQTVEKVDELNSLISCEEVLLSSSEKESQTKLEGSCCSIMCPQSVEKGGEKKRWTMIVDTNTLLHDKSLKHLKLLTGLKGTRLLVPKIVIRELMDIKNQDNFLKRREKKESLALKWIDECLANAKWWIHMEDETANSSEAESQVLETAICLRKEITGGNIVILSNDLSLKIKAMAEGIMCEAAEEFRWSLVNPFSERFMWVGSSAIGLTWSSVDDNAVKSQKYHGCVLNRSQELKGLKLLAYV